MKHKKLREFVAQYAELLRAARRSDVADLELSEDGNKVMINFDGGLTRLVNIEGDSDCAVILDVIRKVMA